MSIEIRNLNKSYRLNEAFIKRIVSEVLNFIKKRHDAEIEIIFLDDEAIKVLNKTYRRNNSSTDVLSFKIGRREFGQKKFLGEVFISLDRAFENSKIFGKCFESEVALYIVHGILHLFGYDDENEKDRLRMSKRQSQVLNYLCKRERLSKVLMPQ